MPVSYRFGTPFGPMPGTEGPGGGMLPPQFQQFVRENYRPVTESPQTAGLRSGVRSLVPGAAWFVDRPQAGYPTDLGNRLGGNLPFGLGQLWTALATGMRTKQRQGWWSPTPENEGWMGRFFSGLDPAVGWSPAPMAAKMGYGAARALAGAPGILGTSLGEASAGSAGAGVNQLFTGNTPFSGWGWPGGFGGGRFSGPAYSGPGAYESVYGGFNRPTLRPDTAPVWYGTSPNVPTSNPFMNPDTGTIPSWAR